MWHYLDRFSHALARLPLADKVVPKALRGKLRPYLAARAMRRLPDRRYMERSILPTLSRLKPERVLFVGTERYTQHYARWFGQGAEYWTLDVRPEAAAYGAPGKHLTGSVVGADTLFERAYFDQVLLNGVFGWGVDEREDQETTIAALRQILKPNGVLVLGWNDHRVQEPLQLVAMEEHFEHGIGDSLPNRQRFEGSTHVYDFFRAR